jgi:hypothetical protein
VWCRQKAAICQHNSAGGGGANRGWVLASHRSLPLGKLRDILVTL